jgi:hypothetical protein
MTDTEALLLARILVLRAAIREFLENYTSRSAKQEAMALRKLRDAMEETG